jgi:1-deoxy-D-xylulose-5-phosphate synthase
VVMAPGDETDVKPMLDFALRHPHPTSLRYPKAALEAVKREFATVELGKAEVVEDGDDGALVVFGTLMPAAVQAAHKLREEGLNVAVVNARFVKPLDRETILPLVERMPFIITVEEGTLQGGFGSAVLEACNAEGIDTRNVVRVGIPDRFIEHAERGEILADLGLDVDGLCRAARRAFAKGREEDYTAVG